MSKDKVIWSDDEKAKIVGRAVALRDGNPSLSGLPLLREAVKGLPVDRQASPVSLAEAPWFLRKLTEEGGPGEG